VNRKWIDHNQISRVTFSSRADHLVAYTFIITIVAASTVLRL
jgi:hypothetical protein